jgi:HEAT repeat protein
MKILAPILYFTLVLIPYPAQAQREAVAVPDLTKGDAIPERASHTWNLGPTGARGWMHSHRLETSQARQIAVMEVASGSPADGKLQQGDVIVGVAGKPFAHDPRAELGGAITRAEAGDGVLELAVWRQGATTQVTLELARLGAYHDTAPFACPKSAMILAGGCKALAERMQRADYSRSQNAITRSLNALALLASGDPAYLPLVRRECQWAAGFSADSFQTWWNAYVIMLLAEYQLATGDGAFQEGMTRLALEAAEGQSIVGSWGHRFAGPDGRLIGYGMMNAPGIPLTIALVMARQAGADEAVIDTAIDRSAKLIRFYSGKGSPPYGDHAPWTQTHEDNGKSGMAAVLFNLLGEADHAAFFTRMSIASHGPERDTGHTGNFTNMLWAMPAVAMGGPDAAGAWMREFGAGYYDLARTWDFQFPHPGPPQEKPCSFGGWDATGAYLLAYAVPERRLLLTGKRPPSFARVSPSEAESLIRDGRGWSNNDRFSAYDSLNQAVLLDRLASWSPSVRERAAIALSRRAKEHVMPVEALIDMLDSPSLHARYGACEALKLARGKAAPAVAALKAQLDHEDLWLRCQSAAALGHIGGPALSVLPDLLERMTRGPSEEDPRGMEQRFFTFAVFGQMLKHSLEGVDREALNRAVVAVLQNQDGRARSDVANIYHQLSFDEIKPLLPAIHEAIVKPAPSGIMFADGIRVAGLELLAKHRVEEGIQAAADYLRDQNRWASEKRTPDILRILESYGAHAQSVVGDLLETADGMDQGEENFPLQLSKQKAQMLRDAAARIQKASDRPELVKIL